MSEMPKWKSRIESYKSSSPRPRAKPANDQVRFCSFALSCRFCSTLGPLDKTRWDHNLGERKVLSDDKFININADVEACSRQFSSPAKNRGEEERRKVFVLEQEFTTPEEPTESRQCQIGSALPWPSAKIPRWSRPQGCAQLTLMKRICQEGLGKRHTKSYQHKTFVTTNIWGRIDTCPPPASVRPAKRNKLDVNIKFILALLASGRQRQLTPASVMVQARRH